MSIPEFESNLIASLWEDFDDVDAKGLLMKYANQIFTGVNAKYYPKIENDELQRVGRGDFGGVFHTVTEGRVIKLTTDETEIQFIESINKHNNQNDVDAELETLIQKFKVKGVADDFQEVVERVAIGSYMNCFLNQDKFEEKFTLWVEDVHYEVKGNEEGFKKWFQSSMRDAPEDFLAPISIGLLTEKRRDFIIKQLSTNPFMGEIIKCARLRLTMQKNKEQLAAKAKT